MANKFDMNNFNNFLKEAQNKLMCDSNCQKQKELEKYKAKTEKLYEKATGGVKKEEVIDENYNYNLNNFQ
jgi:hypothetical protein